MRKLFWLLIATGLGFAIFAIAVLESRLFPGVLGEVVDRWYLDQLVVTVVGGFIIGPLWARRSHAKVLHQPNESGRDYVTRVLRHGLMGMGLAAGVTILLVMVNAARWALIPEVPLDRISQLVFTVKGLGVLSAVAPTMGLAWGLTIRLTGGDWGGARALLPAGKGK